MPARESTSVTLIAQAAAGSRQARETFARVYQPVVRSYLVSRWSGTAHLRALEDALQEVFVDCFREDGALARVDHERPQRFRAYLFGVTRNVALRFEERAGRQRRATPSELQGVEGLSGPAESPSHVFDRAWAQAILREALERMVQEARVKGELACRRVQLLRERFEEDRPIREIARAWNEDAARVHKQYARARDEFKGALKATLAEHCSGSKGVSDEDLMELLTLLRGGPD